MVKPHNIRNPCFKMMLYLALADSICMWGTGFVTGEFCNCRRGSRLSTLGLLAMEGAIYCSHPLIIHLVGSIGTGIGFCLELECPPLTSY